MMSSVSKCLSRYTGHQKFEFKAEYPFIWIVVTGVCCSSPHCQTHIQIYICKTDSIISLKNSFSGQNVPFRWFFFFILSFNNQKIHIKINYSIKNLVNN